MKSRFSLLASRSSTRVRRVHDADESSKNEDIVVSACQRGDSAAYREMYEEYSNSVHRLVYRMVGASEADDVTQQVFVRVLTSIGQYSGRSKFSTWLYRVASNEALQHIRRNAKRRCLPMLPDLVDLQSSATERIDDREMIEHALAQLDPNLRGVFLLREVEQMCYHDIALALDIAEGTVASRLNRARRELRKLLTPNFDD